MFPRNIRPLVLILLAALPLSAPGAHAALPACSDAADWSIEPLHIVQAAHRSELWQEDNGQQGLQTETCHVAGVPYLPDVFLGQVVPRDLGVLGLCSFLVVHQCL